MNFGFGQSTGGMNGQQSQVADMNITGEGTQALSDFGWKKKDNKYVSEKTLTDKESKDQKDKKE